MLSTWKKAKKNRDEILREVLADLESQRRGATGDMLYALEQNIYFFRALRSPLAYLEWLVAELPGIDASRLQELSDFGNPKWQTMLQSELLGIEQWKFPDILAQPRTEIVRQIVRLAESGSGPLRLLDIGAGSMELERQIIRELKKKKITRPVIFTILDNADASIQRGFKNISTEAVPVRKAVSVVDVIGATISGDAPYSIVACEADVFELERVANSKPIFDLVYFSKFKHHLPPAVARRFDLLVMKLSRCVVETDDYRGFYLPFFSTLTAWYKPVLLNGAVFSSLRVPTIKQLRELGDDNWKLSIAPGLGYSRLYNVAQTIN